MGSHCEILFNVHLTHVNALSGNHANHHGITCNE